MNLADKLITPHGREKYWSRSPGKFVNVETGEELSSLPFAGSISDWYHSLAEVISNTSNELQYTECVIAGSDPHVILLHLSLYKLVFNEETNKLTHGVLDFGKKKKIPVYVSEDVGNDKIFVVRHDGVYIPINILDMRLL